MFSGHVKDAIKSGVVSARARREVTQVLRTYITAHTITPSSEQYTTVCRKLVAKYPKLEDTEGKSRIVSGGKIQIYVLLFCILGNMEAFFKEFIQELP